MARKRRRRRRGQPPKSKRASRRREPPAGATTVHDVPDHLLELILLRLDSSACLLRAAASCKRWRRLVTDAGFLITFRSHRAPRVAGYYHTVDPYYELPPVGGDPIFVPSSSLTVDNGRFSLDFLPDRDSWELADSRGSLLLLFKKRIVRDVGSRCFPDLVVCDPLTRRHQGILCPADLSSHQCFGVFLLDGDDRTHGRIVMSNFKVVSVLYEEAMWEDGRGAPLACVFSSGSDGDWRVVQSSSNSDIRLPRVVDQMSFVGRANGSLYWGSGDDGAMLVLDEATVGFSLVLFPDNIWGPYGGWSFRVIGGEDGALRVIRLISNDLKVFARHQGSDKWAVEKLVRLPEATRGLPGREERYFQREAMIVAAHETYILVTPQEGTWLFSVELETMEVEREHERNKYAGAALPFELPALEACADHRRRRRCR